MLAVDNAPGGAGGSRAGAGTRRRLGRLDIMDDADRTKPPPADPEALWRAELIDTLMAGPVRDRPAVTILGDDAVTGFTPLPAASPRKP